MCAKMGFTFSKTACVSAPTMNVNVPACAPRVPFPGLLTREFMIWRTSWNRRINSHYFRSRCGFIDILCRLRINRTRINHQRSSLCTRQQSILTQIHFIHMFRSRQHCDYQWSIRSDIWRLGGDRDLCPCCRMFLDESGGGVRWDIKDVHFLWGGLFDQVAGHWIAHLTKTDESDRVVWLKGVSMGDERVGLEITLLMARE